MSGERKIWDLKQAGFLLNPLKRIEEEEKQIGLELDDVCKRIILGEYLESERLEYATQMSEMSKQPRLLRILFEFDLPLIPILFKMEKKGILIDKKYFEELKTEFTKKVAEFEQKIYTVSGVVFNINSPIQLSKVLFEDLRLPTKGIKKNTRGFSTGINELEKLEGMHPVIKLLKEYREVSKLLSNIKRCHGDSFRSCRFAVN